MRALARQTAMRSTPGLLLANEIGDVARLNRILALGRAYSDG